MFVGWLSKNLPLLRPILNDSRFCDTNTDENQYLEEENDKFNSQRSALKKFKWTNYSEPPNLFNSEMSMNSGTLYADLNFKTKVIDTVK